MPQKTIRVGHQPRNNTQFPRKKFKRNMITTRISHTPPARQNRTSKRKLNCAEQCRYHNEIKLLLIKSSNKLLNTDQHHTIYITPRTLSTTIQQTSPCNQQGNYSNAFLTNLNHTSGRAQVKAGMNATVPCTGLPLTTRNIDNFNLCKLPIHL